MPEAYIMGAEVELYSFILNESERSGSYVSPLIQGKELAVPIVYDAGLDPVDVPDVMEERENQYLAPARNRTLCYAAKSLWLID
jgi:hypothetical protein